MIPLPYEWTGSEMVPVGRFAHEADRQFTIGERYRLAVEEPRSTASHNHEFAWLKEAWQQLPEAMMDQFPSQEHLRKRALIDCGFFRETITDCGSNAAALRVASMLRGREEFALIIVRGGFVVMREAESQSRRSMGGKRFQESKTAIMDLICGMIGVAPEALQRETGRAA